jgi:hypothetical protein
VVVVAAPPPLVINAAEAIPDLPPLAEVWKREALDSTSCPGL